MKYPLLVWMDLETTDDSEIVEVAEHTAHRASGRTVFPDERGSAMSSMFQMDEYEGFVSCPNCGGIHNHMDAVDVASADGSYLRIVAGGEDAGARIAVDLKSDSVQGIDPGRRHVIALYMDCEECGTVTRFTLKQHKGNTFGKVTTDVGGSAWGEDV